MGALDDAAVIARHFRVTADHRPRIAAVRSAMVTPTSGSAIKLLRFVLSAVTLPEAADRVAVSLDDPVQGPFLVVTRTGDFVTCLGMAWRGVPEAQVGGHLARGSIPHAVATPPPPAPACSDAQGGKIPRRALS